ncbi:prostate androgen-regulated mucin-like protein 1 [Erythrolamprus reginae]|uniref:prostate androgen-regulated mucin-like protein 1 n=1 Tax=Erythrolamprus reginae TaxID=121349 RepID=UPI00396CD045
MSPEGGRAPSFLCLIVIAAGLNIYSISSTSTTIVSSIAKTNSLSPSTTKASPVTPSVTTPLTSAEKNTTPWSTPNVISNTSAMTVTTTNLLPQTSIRLQSTEQVSTLGMPVDSSATTNISHTETVATSTSGVTSVSSIINSSFVPENNTSSWVTHVSSTEVSTVPTTSKEHPDKSTISEVTTGPSSSVGKSTYSLGTSAAIKTTPISSATFSPEVTVQEVQQGLSPGSIAAITITVIAVVLVVFGIAAFLKIRHSSYGRLFDDHDHASWGNYNNPLYDDS